MTTAEGTELLETLYAGVEQITSSDDWKAALEVAAKFHKYSFNNTMLILLQTQGQATYVAGYKRWQELGRQVRKGEKSIRILAPVIIKDKDPESPNYGGTKCVGFKGTSVFDISQTDGEPLPERPMPVLLEGEAPEGAMDAVIELIEAEGFSFQYGPAMGRENGYTDYANKVVNITEGLSAAQSFKTAVHELAHAILHNGESAEVDQDARQHRGLAEVQADSAAYIACGILGLDASEYSFPYIAGWSGGDAKAIAKAANGALKVADKVAQAVEGRAA